MVDKQFITKALALTQRKRNRYWDPSAFAAARKNYIESPNHKTMDAICELMFMPLINGYWSRYYSDYPNVSEFEVKQKALIMCWMKFDKFDPDKGSALNYFTKIIQRVMARENRNEGVYRERFHSQDTEKPRD